MRFELFDLQLFINVAERASLTKGAERSALSLPAASTRIKHLEEAAGARLLTRSPQGIELTPAGEIVLRHARRIAQQVGHMTVDLAEQTRKERPHVRLMATTIALAGSLPVQVSAFARDHPDVILDIAERRSTHIVAALQEGRIDIGVLNEKALVEGLVQHTHSRDRLVLAVPSGHRFAGRASIPFADTLTEPHIAMTADSSLGSGLPELAAATGHELVFGTRVNSFESLCRLVAMGLGIGVLPQSSADRYRGHFDALFVPLADEWGDIVNKVVMRDDGIEASHLVQELYARLCRGDGFTPPSPLHP